MPLVKAVASGGIKAVPQANVLRAIARTPARIRRIKQGRRGFFRRAHFFVMGSLGDLAGLT